MTRQKSDGRIVPQDRRKAAPTVGVERRRGGKASTVKQQVRQLRLNFGRAEKAKAEAGAVAAVSARGEPRAGASAVPKPKVKDKQVGQATMRKVVQMLPEAFRKVAANKGAPGPDRQSVEEVRKHLKTLLPALSQSQLEGSYKPGEIRRVWIPKAGGKKRGLGIPNVVDRMVQESVRQVLEPKYEPTFHEASHGFRPGRGCQTAIAAASQHVEDGYEWVVDLDLESFFDRVHHQRLMARLAQKVSDRQLLALIGRMLKAKVVMPDGVVVNTEEGVPQGGPLSPLLSNIVLDELDAELHQRGHRFVRYADDVNIYVKSERAGQRVMESVVRFINQRLRLKVNASKSAVARTEERHFVGFRLRRKPEDGSVSVLLSQRSRERIDEKIRYLTPRSWGSTLESNIDLLNEYLTGWMGFFGICSTEVLGTLKTLDGHIRRRLRATVLKQWKRRRTIVRRLTQLGVSPRFAQLTVSKGRRSLWKLSHTPAVERGLNNAYFAKQGLVTLRDRWKRHPARIVVPVQQELGLG